MHEGNAVTIELSAAEVDLLSEALDSHEYWQLGDPGWRDSGYVILPGEDTEEPTIDFLDGNKRQAITEILEARRLQDLLRAAMR